jgi:molecular chaperone GrpE
MTDKPKAKSKKAKPEDKLQERIDELTGDLQRLQAEFINYKRREAEAKAEITDFATNQVIKELLPLFDNIDRALSHCPDELKDNDWAKGVVAVGRQVEDVLRILGVEKINSLGQPFNHHLHEAISMEDGEGEYEVVIEELQPGYRMGGKVIRHAMVKVGKTNSIFPDDENNK